MKGVAIQFLGCLLIVAFAFVATLMWGAFITLALNIFNWVF